MTILHDGVRSVLSALVVAGPAAPSEFSQTGSLLFPPPDSRRLAPPLTGGSSDHRVNAPETSFVERSQVVQHTLSSKDSSLNLSGPGTYEPGVAHGSFRIPNFSGVTVHGVVRRSAPESWRVAIHADIGGYRTYVNVEIPRSLLTPELDNQLSAYLAPGIDFTSQPSVDACRVPRNGAAFILSLAKTAVLNGGSVTLNRIVEQASDDPARAGFMVDIARNIDGELTGLVDFVNLRPSSIMKPSRVIDLASFSGLLIPVQAGNVSSIYDQNGKLIPEALDRPLQTLISVRPFEIQFHHITHRVKVDPNATDWVSSPAVEVTDRQQLNRALLNGLREYIPRGRQAEFFRSAGLNL